MNKRLFRWKNILRVLGFITVIAGHFLEKTAWTVLGNVLPETNIVQVTGIVLMFFPTIEEIAKTYLEGKIQK